MHGQTNQASKPKQAMDPVTLQLPPYDAIRILCFLREFEYNKPLMQSMADAVDRYEQELINNLSPDQVQEAYMQRHLNQVMGREPREEVFIP